MSPEKSPRHVLFIIGGLPETSVLPWQTKRAYITQLAEDFVNSEIYKSEAKKIETYVFNYLFEQSSKPWKVQIGENQCPSDENQSSSNIAYRADLPIFSSLGDLGKFSENISSQLESLKLSSKLHDLLYVVAYSGGSAIFLDCLGHALNSNDSPSWLGCLKHTFHVAGMTRGWSLNSEMPKYLLVLIPVIRAIPCLANRITGLQFYRGSSFITNMRVALSHGLSLDLTREGEEKRLRNDCKMTYFLGTKDRYLSPADAIEPGYLGLDHKKSQPRYYEIKGCSHGGSNGILASRDLVDSISGCILGKPVSKSHDNTKVSLVPVNYLDDYLAPLDNAPPGRELDVRHVVIILHGIRDSGYWAKRIGHRIKTKWAENNNPERTMRTVTLSYGYFSLWDFVRPGGRKQAVEWFQNAYGDIVSLYPKAKISFIGHSNGTYLGTHALKCKEIEFTLMILAGSVVRRDFWTAHSSYLDRVGCVVNVVALNDYVVGLLPGGYEFFDGLLGGSMDLGGAGAFGFTGKKYLPKKVKEIKITGDHGAGISEAHWDDIADYVCEILQPVNVFLMGAQATTKPDCPCEHLIDDACTSLERAYRSTDNRKALNIWLNNIYRVFGNLAGLLIPGAFAVYFSPLLFAALNSRGLIHVTSVKLPVFGEISEYPIMFWMIIIGGACRYILSRI